MAFLQFKNSDVLLESIREGRPMTRSEKLSLIVGLSIPSMLAQITNVLMFYIDAAMVGRLGARSSAAIGLVESSTWLFGSIATATSMGFSVQVANFIGANDFVKARQVFRHGLIASFVLSLVLTPFLILARLVVRMRIVALSQLISSLGIPLAIKLGAT